MMMFKKIKPLLLSTVLALGLVNIAWAGFDQAMSLYESNDYSGASREFKKLAAQGDADAQYMLGYMYAVGKGLIQDYVEAHKWFNLAASRGNRDALKARASVERKMTREQISLAQKKARDWVPQRYQAPVLTDTDLRTVNNTEPELKDKHSIRAAQYQLTRLGYKPGPVDGAMGSNTRKAIRRYQADQQLLVDGRVTRTLLKALYPEGIPDRTIQTSSAMSGKLLFPGLWESSKNSADDTEQWRVDLQRLIKKGRQEHAAQAWFLNDLETLLVPASPGGGNVVLKDDFKDGDYTLNPAWSVISGNFKVTNTGLFSDMSQLATPKEVSENAIPNLIFGVIMEHAVKGSGATSDKKTIASKPGRAGIVTRTTIPARFAAKIVFSLQSREGEVAFGLYQDKQQRNAYQLLILPKYNQLQLLRTNGNKSAVIESVTVHWSVNQRNHIEWLKDENDEITVALNGKKLFQVRDRQYQKPFSGFMLNNDLSKMTLHSIMIRGK